jgi:glycolate dehydrogenase FAD-binding subunit
MAVSGAPATREELAQALKDAAAAGDSVRLTGGGTKSGWGASTAEPALELPTAGLDRILEHNAGDLTAVLEAGVPLAAAQAAFAEEGQMLALDPPDDGATIGGVVATADSGPLRGRYGGVRDLVVGIRVALSDGSLAKSGGKVIKNVAGYDLSKLFAGSLGTLGAIVEVSVRLHPLSPASATALGHSADPDELGGALVALSRAPLEHSGFDVRWSGGHGALLVRFAGATPGPQAQLAERLLDEAGLETEIAENDETLWAEQRERQRAKKPGGAVVRVSALPTRLPDLLRAADRLGGSVVGRALLGLSWLRLPEPSAAVIDELRNELRPSPCVVLDRPAALDVDPWGPLDPAVVALMKRIKELFDPAGICNPGVYAGGL